MATLPIIGSLARPLLRPTAYRTAAEVHAEAMARGARCTECPFYAMDRGPVLGDIRPGAPLFLAGEGPGNTEIEEGRGFVGASGNIVWAALAEQGVFRSECSVTNATACAPPEGVGYQQFVDTLLAVWRHKCREAERLKLDPPPKPLLPHEACAPKFKRDLEEAQASTFLAIGNRALDATALTLDLAHGAHRTSGDSRPYVASLARQHGAPVQLPGGRVLMASYHPAMAMRGAKEFGPVIYDNIARAGWLVRHGNAIPWKEPEYLLNPSVSDVVRYCQRALSLGAEVTVDIESDSVDVYTCTMFCVNLAYDDSGEERVMVVPIRHRDYSPWWNDYELLLVARALRDVFDRLPLVFHNGGYDTSVLLRVGLLGDPRRTWTDTILLDRCTPANDMAHDLGSVTRRHTWAPMHKADTDHKAAQKLRLARPAEDAPEAARIEWQEKLAAADHELHLYGAKDALVTKRLAPILRDVVKKYGNVAACETDHRMAPVIRQMGNLGMVVDEARRNEMSTILNWQCQKELYTLRSLVDIPKFKPRSVPQLQELIYGKWGYEPTLGTDGFELDDEIDGPQDWMRTLLHEADLDEGTDLDAGSTSSAALIDLMKHRTVKPEHQRFITHLLEYRAYDKLRGTYVDNCKSHPVDWKAHGMDVGTVPATRALLWNAGKEEFEDAEVLPQRSALSVVHSTYKNSVTPTGRLSSTSPNMQNVPAVGKMNLRDMFVAAPGHVLILADYAQLEARIYAVEAQDQILLRTIREGKDIHSMNAASLRANSAAELEEWYKRIEYGEKKYRKTQRTIAKRFCFLEIYGGEEDKLFSVMASVRNRDTGELEFPDITRADVDTWHNNWHKLHPETKRWHQSCHDFYRAFGFIGVQGFDWRRRFFLAGLSKKNTVPNMRIQGKASSLANASLLKLVEQIPFGCWSPWTGIVLQVHDCIGIQVPIAKAKEAERILVECMTATEGGIDYIVEAGCARRWSKAE